LQRIDRKGALPVTPEELSFNLTGEARQQNPGLWEAVRATTLPRRRPTEGDRSRQRSKRTPVLDGQLALHELLHGKDAA